MVLIKKNSSATQCENNFDCPFIEFSGLENPKFKGFPLE